jgi:protein phosphatase
MPREAPYTIGFAQHKGGRKEQQDSFQAPAIEETRFTRHGGYLLLLSDGMGGIQGGTAASTLAVRQFNLSYHDKEPEESVQKALHRSLLEANAAVVSAGAEIGNGGGMGATLLAVALVGRDLYWTSVGDSQLFLFRNGRLLQLNQSHSYGDYLKVLAQHDPAALEQMPKDQHPDALVSHIGMRNLRIIDRPEKAVRLARGDRLLLATDGLFRFLPEERMIEILGQTEGAQAAATALVAQTLQQGLQYQDNLTVLVADCALEPPKEYWRPKWWQIAAAVLVTAGLIAAGLWVW